MSTSTHTPNETEKLYSELEGGQGFGTPAFSAMYLRADNLERELSALRADLDAINNLRGPILCGEQAAIAFKARGFTNYVVDLYPVKDAVGVFQEEIVRLRAAPPASGESGTAINGPMPYMLRSGQAWFDGACLMPRYSIPEEMAEKEGMMLFEVNRLGTLAAATPTQETEASGAGEVCYCQDCGKSHHKLPNGTPPWGAPPITHKELCILSQTFTGSDNYRGWEGNHINEWLKYQLGRAYEKEQVKNAALSPQVDTTTKEPK